MSHVFVPMGIGRRLERGHLQSQVRLRAATRYPWDGESTKSVQDALAQSY